MIMIIDKLSNKEIVGQNRANGNVGQTEQALTQCLHSTDRPCGP